MITLSVEVLRVWEHAACILVYSHTQGMAVFIERTTSEHCSMIHDTG